MKLQLTDFQTQPVKREESRSSWLIRFRTRLWMARLGAKALLRLCASNHATAPQSTVSGVAGVRADFAHIEMSSLPRQQCGISLPKVLVQSIAATTKPRVIRKGRHSCLGSLLQNFVRSAI